MRNLSLAAAKKCTHGHKAVTGNPELGRPRSVERLLRPYAARAAGNVNNGLAVPATLFRGYAAEIGCGFAALCVVALLTQAAWSQSAPAINSLSATPPGLSQALAPWHGAPFTLTINGQNFANGAQLQFGTALLAATYVDSSRLEAVVPTSALSTVGQVVVKVTNPDGATSAGVDFFILERGDINHSRTVNIGDALATARTVGGLDRPGLSSAVGDINFSGGANIGDALKLALFVGGIDPNLPTPVISSASPDPAAPGGEITITGSGFSTIAANHRVVFPVTNDSIVRITPTASTSSSLTVTVPNNAVSGLIEIIRVDATMGSPEFPLTISNVPAPLALSSVSPSYQVIAGDSLTLNGMGFDANPANNAVFFKSSTGTIEGTITSATSTRLTVTVPPAATCGPITVRTGGQTSNSRVVIISGTACGVQLADVWGGGAPGDIVVLEGAGFELANPGRNVVNFSGSTGFVAAPVLQVGRTQMHVQIPAAAIEGPVTVTVTASGGSSQTSNALVYRPNKGPIIPVPVLSSITPDTGAIGATVAITLSGSNFSPGTTTVAVSGNGVTVSNVSVTSPTSLTATFTIDATTAPGTRSVALRTSVGSSGSADFGLTYPTPVLGAVSPSPIGKGSTAITIAGSSFTSATTATFNGTPIQNVTYVNPTLLTATLACSTAGTYQLQASNPSPGGSASNSIAIECRDATVANRIRVLDLASDVEVSELAVTVGGRPLQPRVQIVDNSGAVRDDIKPVFSSLSPEIAVVDANSGVIRALKAGFSTLTISAGGSVATITITVVEVGSAGAVANSVAQDAAGRIYLASSQEHVILSAMDLKQASEVYAGVRGSPGSNDGPRVTAKFNRPEYIAFDNTERGFLYVSDTANHVIRLVQPGPNGRVETFAGRPGVSGAADGPLSTATFNQPKGIALDSAGNLWIADSGNCTIRRINAAAGRVETIAGTAGQCGLSDLSGADARFNEPIGIAVEPPPLCQGLSCFRGVRSAQVRVVVADTKNRVIRRVSETGVVETIRPSGPSGVSILAQKSPLPDIAFLDSANQPVAFSKPTGIAMDSSGNIYVTDPDTTQVRVILPNNEIADAVQLNTFEQPTGVTVTQQGKIVVADTKNAIGEIRYGGPEIERLQPGRVAGGGGERITIHGKNFAPDTIVVAGGILVPGRTIVNTHTITFTAPPLLSGVTTVSVQNRGGLDQKPLLVDAVPLRELSPGQITTVAGGSTFAGDGAIATSARLNYPQSLTVDTTGNRFVADTANHRVRRIDALTGIITTVAGTGQANFSGDNGPGTAASLSFPAGLAVDAAGNLFIADAGNNRIRRVAAGTGIITTYAGNGTAAFSGDNGAATSASLATPVDIALDLSGNLFIADTQNSRIRKVAAGTGTITTVAGNGTVAFSGDNGAATLASLGNPSSVAVDAAGNVFIADTDNNRIRRIAASSGTITTIAGNGDSGYSGDNGPASAAGIGHPLGLAVDGDGNLFVSDTLNYRIRRVASTGGNVTSSSTITTVAGNGQAGFSGDNGPASTATLNEPRGLAVDAARNLWIADTVNHRIRKVSPQNVITTAAGAEINLGDGDFAQAAILSAPAGIAIDAAGSLFIADVNHNRIRKVDGATRIVTTVAGSGGQGYSGDGGQATAASISYARGIAVDGAGNLLIADSGNNRIRKVATNGIITTIAGGNQIGFSGDGGPATSATLAFPAGLALDSADNVHVADSLNHRIRKILASSNTITSVGGNGEPDFSGDNGRATFAALSLPSAVAVDSAGNIYVADTLNSRIRKIAAASGIITTVAGNGQLGFAGDNGPATSASLSFPFGVAVDSGGNIYVADTFNNRIRKIAAQTGMITTIAGNGNFDLTGDGGPAQTAALALPTAVAVDIDGNVFFADTANNRIRAVRGTGVPPAAVCAPIAYGQTVNGQLSTTDSRSGNTSGSYFDCYTFTAAAGDRINITLSSSSFQTRASLANAARQIVAFNEAPSGSNDSRIPASGSLLISSPGRYFIDATSSTVSTGSYSLALAKDTSAAASCSPLVFGTPVNGSLAFSDGPSKYRTESYADCYTFTGNAGDQITVALSSSAFDTFVYLTDPAQNLLYSDDDGGGGSNSRIPGAASSGAAATSLVLPANGTYTVEATSFYAAQTGSYFLTPTRLISSAAPTCNSITTGQSVNGSLSTTDSQARNRPGSYADCYTFSGTRGDRVSVTMTSSAFDTFLFLTEPSSQLIASADDGGGGTNSRIPLSGTLTLPNTGTYTIEAASYAFGSTGAYTLTFVKTDASTTPQCASISPGQTITGTLSTTDRLSGNRSGSRSDCFTFSATAGDRVSIELNSSAFDTYLYLMNPLGQVIDADDDGLFAGESVVGSRLPAVSGFVLLPTSGTYIVEATSYLSAATGSYTLKLTRDGGVVPQVCGTLSFGQTVTGSLAAGDATSRNRAGSYADCFTFSATSGDRINIAITSSAFDTYLYLMNPIGQVLTSDDDGGTGSNSRIPQSTGTLLLPSTGMYTIEATSFAAGATGSYTMTLTRDTSSATPSCVPIAYGQTINGSLAGTDAQSRIRAGSYGDCYTFQGTSGDRITIAMNSVAVDSYLYLINPDGQLVTFDDDGSGTGGNSRIPLFSGSLELVVSGTYTIETTTFAPGETGTYTVALTRESTSAPVCTAIAYGATVNGTLTTSSLSRHFIGYGDCYSFSGTAGDKIVISMNSRSPSPLDDPYLVLLDTSGQILDYDDDSGGGTNARIPLSGTFTLPFTGTYLIEATSYFGDSTGAYSISLSRVP